MNLEALNIKNQDRLQRLEDVNALDGSGFRLDKTAKPMGPSAANVSIYDV
jgi:hypothetical protein